MSSDHSPNDDTTNDAANGPSTRWPIPPEWCWARISDVGVVKLGRQLAASKRRDTKSTPYLRAANIGEEGLKLADVLHMDLTERERESLKLQDGDIVLSEASGSPDQVGKSAVWRDQIPDCCFQNTVIRFRPHALQPEFALILFRYLFVSGVFARTSHGVGIQHLGASAFAQLEVPVPGTLEQERIVSEINTRLKHLADARVSMESALAAIDHQGKAVIEWIITGQKRDPESGFPAAELEGIRPTTEIHPLARVEIPKDWRWIKVSEAGELKLGRQRSPKHQHGPHLMPYLRVANVFEDRIDTSDVLSMNFTPEEQEALLLREGDVLLNEGQSAELVGRPAMYRGDPPSVCFQNTLIRFRANPTVSPDFALLVFRHYLHSGVFRAISRMSVNIAHLGLQRLADLPFPCPPKDVQVSLARQATARMDDLILQKTAIQRSLEHIREMAKAIQQSAVHGELTTRDSAEETALEMLARLGPPPKENVPRVKRSRPTDEEEELLPEHDDLIEILRANGGSLSADRLFQNARYKKDQTAEFVDFYLALRERNQSEIRIKNPDEATSATIEVIPKCD